MHIYCKSPGGSPLPDATIILKKRFTNLILAIENNFPNILTVNNINISSGSQYDTMPWITSCNYILCVRIYSIPILTHDNVCVV